MSTEYGKRDEDDILSGGGGTRKPKVTVPEVGETLAGIVVGAWESQSRKWDSKLRKGTDLLFWGPDNTPTTTVTDRPVIDQFVVLAAFAPTDEDDGKRSFCLTSKRRVRDARKRINDKQGGLRKGGHLTVTREKADAPDKPGALASQQLELIYLTPEDVTLNPPPAPGAEGARKPANEDDPFS